MARVSSLLGPVLGLLLTLAPSILSAQQPAPATSHLREKHEEVMRIMRRDASTDEARRRRSQDVTRLLSELLDYEELSKRALGTHWEARAPAERSRFVDLLRQLVERNYEANLQRILDFEVRYTAEESVSDATVVRTEARSRTERRQPPVNIAYSMKPSNGGWRVFDVDTDGVSLVRNYRNQFNRIITQNGWDELIRRMEQRLANGGE